MILQVNKLILLNEIYNRVKDLNLSYCHYMNLAGGPWHGWGVKCLTRIRNHFVWLKTRLCQ